MRAVKKIALLLALLLAVLALGGCGEKSERLYSPEDVQTLLEAGAFTGEMGAVDGEVLTLLYGVDPATVTDCAGCMAMNSASSADEVAVLILTDEASAQAAEEALYARVSSQLKICQTYAPAAMPHLEAAVIDRVGNTVLLAVGEPDVLPGAVENLGK